MVGDSQAEVPGNNVLSVPALPRMSGQWLHMTGELKIVHDDKLVLIPIGNARSFFITKTCPCNIQRFFSSVKIEKFMRIFFIFFLFLLKNIDCGYSLEPPRQGGSNEYPQSMFLSKNKKNRYTPANPSFAIYKSGVQGGIYYTDMFS